LALNRAFAFERQLVYSGISDADFIGSNAITINNVVFSRLGNGKNMSRLFD